MALGLKEKIDEAFFQIHRWPAAKLKKLLEWSEYKTAKAATIIGYTSLATYVSSTIALLYSNGAEELHSIEKIVTATGALLVGLIYGHLMRKNFNEARLAELREGSLTIHNLLPAIEFEGKLQRHRRIREASHYAISLPMWLFIMLLYNSLGSVDIRHPASIAMVTSATIATACLYGPRYVLTSRYGSKSLDNNLSGDVKNAD